MSNSQNNIPEDPAVGLAKAAAIPDQTPVRKPSRGPGRPPKTVQRDDPPASSASEAPTGPDLDFSGSSSGPVGPDIDASGDVLVTSSGLAESLEPTGDARDVIILLPQYKQTNPLTMTSVMALRDPRRNAMVCAFGDAFIAHTRNKLADAFMRKTSAQWALFVDDDMVVPMGNASWFKQATGFAYVPDRFAALHTIDRLLAAKRTLVGGLYFGRQPGAEKRAMFAEGRANGPYAAPTNGGQSPFATLPRDHVVPTKWVGTGCLLVHRRVFVDIQTRFPHLAPKTPEDVWQYFSGAQDELMRALDQYFSGQIQREQLAAAYRRAGQWNLNTGEDVLFCSRASESGHQPHVDLGLLCGHVGHHVYGAR